MTKLKTLRWTAAAALCCCLGAAHADVVDIDLRLVSGTVDAWGYWGQLGGSQVIRFNFAPVQQLALNYSIIIETDATGLSEASFASSLVTLDSTSALVFEGLTDTNAAQYTFNGLLQGASHSIALDFSGLAFSNRRTVVSIASNPLVYRQASPVPEPAGWALLLLGLPLIAQASRRLARDRKQG
jgi:hypothetical protein